MSNRIFKKNRLSLILAVTLLIAFIGNTRQVSHAATGAFISDFYANCSFFNVDVRIGGSNDDGGGLDKIRYQIVDAKGHLLYQEDGTRPIGVNKLNLVYNVAYQNGATPTQNPVTFKLFDLDKNGNPAQELREGAYDVSCLPLSGKSNFDTKFEIPDGATVTILADSALYDAPDGTPTTYRVHKSESWLGVYRTADNRWVGVYTSGNILGWLPALVVGGPYTILPMRATRIERVYVNGIPDGIIFYSCPAGGVPIMVRNAPDIDAPSIGVAEGGTAWRVTGQLISAKPYYDRTQWLRIEYNGQTGWVLYTNAWICLRNGNIRDIPIIKG